MNLLKLFIEFFKIGAFSYGGGMSTLPYIYEMIEKTNLVDSNVITNILTVSQITPGPFACNVGTVVGNKIAGIPGSIVCNIAFVLPEIIFAELMYKVYEKVQKNQWANQIIKATRASTLALVLVSSISIFKEAFIKDVEMVSLNGILLSINYRTIMLGIIVFLVAKYKKINTIYLIIISIVIAGIIKA